jgi:hypothetical protein
LRDLRRWCPDEGKILVGGEAVTVRVAEMTRHEEGIRMGDE